MLYWKGSVGRGPILGHHLQWIGFGTIPFGDCEGARNIPSTKLRSDTYPLSRWLSFLFLPFLNRETAYLILGDHQLRSPLIPFALQFHLNRRQYYNWYQISLPLDFICEEKVAQLNTSLMAGYFRSHMLQRWDFVDTHCCSGIAGIMICLDGWMNGIGFGCTPHRILAGRIERQCI